MKHLIFFFFLFLLASSLNAKNVYLSSSGNDDSDGLSEDAAVATLTKALSLCEDDDNLYVLGIIDVSQEVSGSNGFVFPDVKINVDGTDNAVSGFQGNGKTRILLIDSNRKNCTFRNLTFTNGSGSVSQGVSLYINNSDIRFENCHFKDNTGNRRNSDGAVFVNGSDISFESCVFSGNNVRQGGGLYLEACSAQITACIIENNVSTYSSSAGGGIYALNCESLTLKNSIIQNCKTLAEGAGIYWAEDGEIKNRSAVFQIESSLIGNNSSDQGGGGIYVSNPTQGNIVDLNIINTTVYGNSTQERGAGILINDVQAGTTLDMINCTLVANKTAAARDNGAGICINSRAKDIVVGIYNSILESSSSTMTNQASDIVFKYSVSVGENFILNNSYIGEIINLEEVLDEIRDNGNRTAYRLSELAELALPYSEFIASQHSIPLEFNSSALYAGNAQFLKDLNISTDQNGNPRLFENGKCAIGAVEKAASPPSDAEAYTLQHFIMNGQSLSTGHEAYPVSTENIEGNYMFGEQIWINYGNKNFEELNPLKATIALNYSDLSECPLHGAVNHIRLKQQEDSPELGNRFIATSVGISGQPIEALSKESKMDSYYSDFQSALKYAKKYATKTGSSISCPGIFWLQGEWNYQGHGNGLVAGSKPAADKNEYKSLMIKLKNNMQDEISERYLQDERPIFYTYQVGAQYTSGLQLAIGMAQLEASNEYEDVICVGPVYPQTDVGGHLDGNGYRWYGEMIGKVYYKTQLLGEDFKPLQPKRISRDETDSKTVNVTYHVPEPPLVLDVNTLKKQTDYGFALYSDGRVQSISKIEILNDTVLSITSSADLSGKKIAVTYGSSRTSGHGNLRDSDSYQAFFNYENPDKKDEDGNFVFPHGNKTSLIPVSGEPKDENGNVIYEKPYPLYNFSVAFYYEVESGENEFVVSGFEGKGNVSVPAIKQDEIAIKQNGNNLYVTSSSMKVLSIDLFDISGKKIKEILPSLSSDGTVVCSLNSLPRGIYIVKVLSEGQSKSQKIFVI